MTATNDLDIAQTRRSLTRDPLSNADKGAKIPWPNHPLHARPYLELIAINTELSRACNLDLGGKPLTEYLTNGRLNVSGLDLKSEQTFADYCRLAGFEDMDLTVSEMKNLVFGAIYTHRHGS